MAAGPQSSAIQSFRDEFARYQAIGEKAIAQASDEALNRVVAPEGNSIAMIVRHMSGNLVSRFTDFLISDGEKPWRNREGEFEERTYTRAEVGSLWAEGWRMLEDQLAGLGDSQLGDTVTIRGAKLTVHEALSRSVCHAAYHIGQIVLLARILAAGNWDWISIPKGQSAAYNQNPTMEKQPR